MKALCDKAVSMFGLLTFLYTLISEIGAGFRKLLDIIKML